MQIKEQAVIEETIRMTACLFSIQKKESGMIGFFLEARAGFEPAIRVLQTRALPLGYHAIYHFYNWYYIMAMIRTQAKNKRKKSGLYWNKDINKC